MSGTIPWHQGDALALRSYMVDLHQQVLDLVRGRASLGPTLSQRPLQR